MSTCVFSFVIIFFSMLFHFYWKKRKIYALSRTLPGPLCLPIVGNALTFMCKDEEIFGRLSRVFAQYPSPMRMWIGQKFFIVFKEAEQIQKIMSSSSFLNKDEDVYRFMKVYDGEGMIPGSGPKWKQDRKLIAPLFSYKNILEHFALCLREADILVSKLKPHVGKEAFDVEEHMQRCSADIVAEILSGFKLDAQNKKADIFLENFKRAYVIIHARVTKLWLQNDSLFKYSSYYQEQEYTKKIVHDRLKYLLEKSKETYDSNGENHKCTIHQMLKIKEDIPNFVTDMEIVHHLSTFFSAVSQDTIALVSSFALVMLGMYPKIQQNIVDEISKILGRTGGAFEVVDIQKFVYLEMCIKEVLRLFPIGPYIVRVASEDVVIDSRTIPKGCSVVVAIYNIHRDPKYWKKPNEFYPEHFSADGESQRHPYAFIPFSAGLRGCIGKALAMMAIKTLLIRILQNYEIEADGKLEDKELKVDISLRFIDNNYPIRIKQRTLL